MTGTPDAVRDFLAAGWTEVRHANHYVMRCPCGRHQTSLSKTTGDNRYRRNALREITKCRKESDGPAPLLIVR